MTMKHTFCLLTKPSQPKEYSVLHGLERLEDVSQTITKGVYAISLEDAKARKSRKKETARNETSGGLGFFMGDRWNTGFCCAEMA